MCASKGRLRNIVLPLFTILFCSEAACTSSHSLLTRIRPLRFNDCRRAGLLAAAIPKFWRDTTSHTFVPVGARLVMRKRR